MFLVTALFLNTAKTKQALDNAIFQTAGIAQKYNCVLKRLDYQQEEGLMSSVPLGVNHIPIKRALTTTSTAIFVPFTTQELFMAGESLYYGLNALSNNMIMVDRKKLKNPNGLILGTPGSGKSFAAKREITNAFFVTKDDIIIGDPEGEYYPQFFCIASLERNARKIYEELENVYRTSEEEIRNRLQDTINDIFKQIYEGGLSLTIDSKYHITVQANDYEGDVETSTAQSISVIFAFITGIIKMASEKDYDKTLLTDELIDPDKQVRLELWAYNPKQFSEDNSADDISLVLSFTDTNDERIEEAVDELQERRLHE